LQHGLEGEVGAGLHGGGLVIETDFVGLDACVAPRGSASSCSYRRGETVERGSKLTVELLEDTVHGAGAAAAGHAHVECVCVVGHLGGWCVLG
jgi:hypothetical protein